MTSTTTTFQGRWGYHPCDYELFLKLKSLHRWYWQTIYDFHRWHRWWRKEEQNRVGPEPRCWPLLVLNQTWYKPVRCHGVDGHKVYPKTVTDQGIVDLYQQARMPQPAPVTPFGAETKARIEALHEQATSYFVN